MMLDGWNIVETVNSVFIVHTYYDSYNIYIDINKQNEDMKISFQKASEYGLILNPAGYIIDYDESKHIKNKHLLICTDLGLL